MMTADSWRVGMRERNRVVGRLDIFEVRRALRVSMDREMKIRRGLSSKQELGSG